MYTRPILDLEAEFLLMVNYQITLESRSVIVENSDDDDQRYSLFEVVAPYPTYGDFLDCEEFEEGEIIAQSSNMEELKNIQEGRRAKLINKEVLVETESFV